MITVRRTRVLSVFCAAFLLAGSAFAQTGAEVTGFGGLLHNDGSDAGLAGASVGASVVENVLVQGEFSYAKDHSLNMYQFAFGPQILLPIRHSRLTPYLAVDFDATRFTMAGFDSSTKYGFGIGAGVRIQAGRNWGFRPEFKAIKLKDVPTFTRFSAGLYYQFGR